MSAQMAFVTTGISGASSDTSCWLVTLSYTKQGQKNLISLERPKAPQRAKIQGMTHQPAFFWVCLYVYVCVCVRLSMLPYLVLAGRAFHGADRLPAG